MLETLFTKYSGKVTCLFTVFPLPYHTFAFRASQAAHVIVGLNGSDAAFHTFAALMYANGGANQAPFFAPTLSTAAADAALVTLAVSLGYDKAAVTAGMASDAYNMDTRIGFKVRFDGGIARV